jgi:hypothetical protein
MPSWRDSASPHAQADLDALLNSLLGFAQQQLASHGEFHPYAAAIRTDGRTEMMAGRLEAASEHPAAADIVASCVAELTSLQHMIRAAAITTDVYLPDLGSDAIEICLEHAEGQALRIHLPYAKRRKEISYGSIRASAGTRRIWAHS